MSEIIAHDVILYTFDFLDYRISQGTYIDICRNVDESGKEIYAAKMNDRYITRVYKHPLAVMSDDSTTCYNFWSMKELRIEYIVMLFYNAVEDYYDDIIDSLYRSIHECERKISNFKEDVYRSNKNYLKTFELVDYKKIRQTIETAFMTKISNLVKEERITILGGVLLEKYYVDLTNLLIKDTVAVCSNIQRLKYELEESIDKCSINCVADSMPFDAELYKEMTSIEELFMYYAKKLNKDDEFVSFVYRVSKKLSMLTARCIIYNTLYR